MKKPFIIFNFLVALISWPLSSCSESYHSLEKKMTGQVVNTWVMTSMDSIGAYLDSIPQNRAIMYLAKGDVEHLQIAVKVEKTGSLEIQRFPEKKSDITFSARNVVVWNQAEDVLVPLCDTFNVAEDAKLWFTFKTTEQTKPDVYNEVIKLSGTAGEYLLHVKLHVYDCAIPTIPTIPSVFGIDPNRMGINNLLPEEASVEKKKWSDLLLTYRISPYFSNWIGQNLEVKDMRVENISSPWEWNDPRTIEYFKNPLLTKIALPSHFLSDQELNQFIGELKKNDLLRKSFFYIWDEPKMTNEYEFIKKETERIRQFAPEAEIMTTFFCGPRDGERKNDLFAVFDYLRGTTTIFCQGVWSLSANEQKADSCRKSATKEGEEWWTYVCMSDHPGLSIKNNWPIRNRAVLWRGFKEGTEGFLYWVVNSFDSVAPLIPRQNLPHGDGILVFPGKEFGLSDELVVSARLERWRDGAEDYELLKQLEAKKGRETALQLLSMVHKGPLRQTKNPRDVIEFKKRLLETLTSD